MDTIATVTTCMGRLGYLQLTIPCLYGQPDQHIVVDYSCPEQSGDWVINNYPDIEVIKVPGHTYFNKSKALNIGAAAAQSDWICFMDADTVASPHLISTIKTKLKPGTFIRATSGDDLCGFVVCQRSAWEIVKYNEEMEGWGGEDLDFVDGLGMVAKHKEIAFNDYGYLGSLNHSNELRTKYYYEKVRGESQKMNDKKRRWRK